MFGKCFAVVGAMIAASLACAQIKMTVNVKEGDKIGGEQYFRVNVESQNLVTSVEFSVGNDLRETDNSTPYEFRLDTLAESEGPVKITFAAYTSEGENVKTTLNLVIDNQLSLGADHFVAKGQEALTASKWDEAIGLARIALKAKAGYNPARMVMARAHYGKGVMDSALKFAQDVLASDKDNDDALNLVSAINLQKAFGTFNRGGDKNETLKTLKALLIEAASSRFKVFESRLGKIQPTDAATTITFADTAIRAGRYSIAIDVLQSAFRRDERNSEIANRLLYAQLRASRMSAAIETATTYSKRGRPDAVGYALLAITNARQGKLMEVDDFMRQAVLNDSQSLGVRTAQTYLALLQGRTNDFRRLAADLGRDNSNSAEVGYYQHIGLYLGNNFEESRDAFERAVLAEPITFDLYVQRANQALQYSFTAGLDSKEVTYQRDVARVFFEAALAAKPESFEALTGLALTNLVDNKLREALTFARAAAQAGPEFAGGQYVLSSVLSSELQRIRAAQVAAEDGRNKARNNNLKEEVDRYSKIIADLRVEGDKVNTEMVAAVAAAAKADKPNLEGAAIPQPMTAFNYFYRFGRTPLLILGG